MIGAAVAVLVFAPMLVEAVISTKHERVLRAQGATEPRDDVIGMMRVAYPGAFAVMLLEGTLGGMRSDRWLTGGIALLAIAKALKYWAIATLGSRWTFRVLVPPGGHRIATGPYRWLAHPNYVAVAGELAAIAIATRAAISGPIATVAFILLMRRRVVVEERALLRSEPVE